MQLQEVTVLVLIKRKLNFLEVSGTVLEFSFFSHLFSRPGGVGGMEVGGQKGESSQGMSKWHSQFSCLWLNHDSLFLTSFVSSPFLSLFSLVMLCQALFWELRKEHISNWNKIIMVIVLEGAERNKAQEKQVLHYTIAHPSLTFGQLGQSSWPCSLPVSCTCLLAEHGKQKSFI